MTIPDLRNIAARKVLVTGATGFTGAHLTQRLMELGAQVRVLVRSTSDPETLRKFAAAGVEIVEGDVTDRAAVARACEGREHVFHLAALFRQAKYPDQVYHDVNVGGTQNVLDASRAAGVGRVVHCSTVGVHSHIPSPPANEDEDYRPGDIYQKTKCEGEKLARSYFETGQCDGVVVRPAMIWGDGDRRTLKLFRGVSRRRFPLIGSGNTLTHWVHVHDLVDGFILAALKANASGRVYILAGRRPVTIRELIATIADAAGVKPLPISIPAFPIQLLGSVVEKICIPLNIEPPIYRRRVDFFTKTRCFDTTRAREELGFSPRHDFPEEVKRIHHWYRTNGWL